MRPISAIVDSCTVLIPDHLCQYPPNLFLKVYHVDEDGLILDTKQKPVLYEENGIRLVLFKFSLFGEEFINFTLTSKIQGSDYLKGCLYNVDRIVNFLFEKLNFHITVSDFKTAKVNDVDFAVDFLLSDEDYNKLLSSFRGIANTSFFYEKAQNFVDSRRITGLSFGSRDTANIRFPFVKFYDKYKELHSRSLDFLLHHKIQPETNRKRLEVTIKNKKHFESLAKKGVIPKSFVSSAVTVDTLLHFDDMLISSVVQHCYNHYVTDLQPFKHSKTGNSEINPTDFIIGRLVYELVKNNGYTLAQCINFFNDYPSFSGVAKSRMKSRIKKAFSFMLSFYTADNLKLTAKDAFFISSNCPGK